MKTISKQRLFVNIPNQFTNGADPKRRSVQYYYNFIKEHSQYGTANSPNWTHSLDAAIVHSMFLTYLNQFGV